MRHNVEIMVLRLFMTMRAPTLKSENFAVFVGVMVVFAILTVVVHLRKE